MSHLHYEKDAIIISKYTTKKDFKQIQYGQIKKTKRQTMIHETVPAPLVAPVVLHLLHARSYVMNAERTGL